MLTIADEEGRGGNPNADHCWRRGDPGTPDLADVICEQPLNVFVIFFVSLFVFVIVLLLVRSCFLITLSKYLKGHMSQKLLFVVPLGVSLNVFVIVIAFVFFLPVVFLLVM